MNAAQAMAAKSCTEETSPSPTAARHAPVLRIDAVTKAFGPVVALSDVTLDIIPGEVHAIVGENGAGKSTLINIASGTVSATSGSVFMQGERVDHPTPAAMRQRGIAVVHQHPALAPDLTVRENIALGLDGDLSDRASLLAALADVASGGMGIDPDDKVSELSIAQWHVVEITKAMLLRPRILILDEPTEPFGKGETERLFGLIRTLVASGVAVVYISHRLQEVLSIADIVTVLRDGKLIATMPRNSLREEDVVAKIAGRTMDRLFPEKAASPGAARLSVRDLTGAGFEGVTFDLPGGAIVGLAGIEGQGQRQFLRALVGLESAQGLVLCDGRPVPLGDRAQSLRRGIGFVTDNRHAEGLFAGLPLTENLTVPVLSEMTRSWLISPALEAAAATAAIERFSIKAPGARATPRQLSGGNQQKVLFARELGAAPKVLIVDEPTKGVDVGARFEIYKALRALNADGTAVLVLCSDALELQGLCDTVHVFSNGRIVETLEGERLTETNIAGAMIGNSQAKRDAAPVSQSTRWQRFAKGDRLPIVPVGVVTLAIMAVAAILNPYYLTAFNLAAMGSLLAVLLLIAVGQACVFAVGGIDLSSGPLAGLVVVLASFLIAQDGGSMLIGAGAILAIASTIGLFHAAAILFLRLPPIIVTLATFVALGGVSLVLRPEPAGAISYDYIDVIETRFLGVPFGLLVALAATLVLAATGSFTRIGRQMRAWGSDAPVALRLGIEPAGVTIPAYVASAFLSGMAGLLLAAQIGIGSAAVGTEYTLMGITAVVISGASVTGGRLSFLAILVAATLVQVTLNVTSFLNLDTAWQYWLVGGATILGAAVFSQLRGRSRGN